MLSLLGYMRAQVKDLLLFKCGPSAPWEQDTRLQSLSLVAIFVYENRLFRRYLATNDLWINIAFLLLFAIFVITPIWRNSSWMVINSTTLIIEWWRLVVYGRIVICCLGQGVWAIITFLLILEGRDGSSSRIHWHYILRVMSKQLNERVISSIFACWFYFLSLAVSCLSQTAKPTFGASLNVMRLLWLAAVTLSFILGKLRSFRDDRILCFPQLRLDCCVFSLKGLQI